METEYALNLVGFDAERVHINRFAGGEKSLGDYEIILIPGGFSYGDDVAAGVIMANEITRKLVDSFGEFIEKGKLIMGICNGFQVLVRSGLLPFGLKNNDVKKAHSVTLTTNDSGLFEDRWVNLKAEKESPCVFTNGLKELIYLPVAHAEGNFQVRSPETIKKIEENHQVVFRYATPDGGEPTYPENPNGSAGNIGGICDPTGRIFGMMPHPERYLHRINHPRWTREDLPEEGDGVALFRNAYRYISD